MPVGLQNDENARIATAETLTMAIWHQPVGNDAMKQSADAVRRVLVMDDEDQLRKVVGRMLQFLGHEVTTTASGEEAIEEFQQALNEEQPFDLVILDLTVFGGLGGKDALVGMLAIDPGVKAIASSGYAGDDVIDNFAEFGFAGALAKPYRINDLRDKIASVMGPGE